MTPDAPPEAGFVEMVESCFDSVWSLELLLLLHAQPDRRWTTPEMVAELRSSELVVSQSVRGLLSAGLLVEESEGIVRYSTISGDLDLFVIKLDHEYRARPTRIRRLIVGRPNAKLSSFSNAFNLRKSQQ